MTTDRSSQEPHSTTSPHTSSAATDAPVVPALSKNPVVSKNAVVSNSKVGPKNPGRRKVLAGIGISAGAVAVGGAGVAAAQDGARQSRPGGARGQGRRGQSQPGTPGGRGGNGPSPDSFSRLFNEPSFAEPSQELREALIELGRPGGQMDAGDDLARGPIELITDLSLSNNNPNNPAHTAGTTFMGQFLDHDMTRDAGSPLGRPTPVGRSTNLRSASFDLDSVYGAGPVEHPELYQSSDQILLRVESGGRFEDLPRDDEGVAILGDDRNDENLMLSGLHAAYLMFHNAVVARLRSGAPAMDDGETFRQARRLVTWHHQWIIVHEVLPQFVGQTMVDDVLANGRQFATAQRAQIPIEFQTAAYRFGHSLIRPSYRANMAGDNGEPFFGFVFDPEEFGKDDPDDLAGHRRAERRYIGWQTFFDFGDGEVKPNKRIDTTLSTPLFQLPLFAIGTARGEDVGPTSLATRNLLRHITWEVPSGQRIAERMNADQLSSGDLTDLSNLGANLVQSTPLWFYILREAEVFADGLHLGPVGGRIVAEVFLSALQLDPNSYLAADPGWKPVLPTLDRSVGFGMTDLLTVAGVDPVSRGE